MTEWITHNPAIAISAGALLVSLIALISSWIVNKKNDRRWDSINTSRLVVRNLRMAGWKTITKAEFDNTDWGYDDRLGLAFVDDVGNVDLERVIVPIQVIAVHPQQGVVTGLNCLTVNELLDGLRKNGVNPQGLELQKLIRIVFILENAGTTTASDVSMDVLCPIVDPALSTKKAPAKFSMQPSEQYWTSSTLRFGLEEPLPKELPLSIRVSHIDANERKREDAYNYVIEKSTGTFRRR